MSGGIIKVSRNTERAPICELSSQTVAFSHYNNISAQLPVSPETGEIIVGDIKQQAKQCLENIKAIVESIDHTLEDVVKINVFLKNINDLDAVDEVYANYFQQHLPTRTALAVEALPLSDALVQMDALISNGEGTAPQAPCNLIKLSRNTDKAPTSAISTQTVAFSHYNNLSAQLPIDPATGNLIQGGVKEQAKQCLTNIKAVMESIDVPYDDIVNVRVYLSDLADLDAVNEVYTTFFPDSAIARSVAYVPARTIISAKALPMNALVQMDVVVSHGDGTPPQEVEDRHGIVIRAHNTDGAPFNALHTHTVAFSHYNHIAAQLPLNPMTNQLVTGGVKEQAQQCLNNIKAIIESIDHVMDDIVKVNIQLRNIEDLHIVDEIYAAYFEGDLPARTVVGVSDIAMNALMQIDVVASNGEGTPPRG
ncbi:endoribonuclease L-PSP [Vibrio coralliilyticus]|uniref:Endoribonuclease L-PSP n=1 Tax=Vibrio coralliilyticus TaxID=190893 RepID=A0A837G442_9VIBR|nr:RidA family protein [Vibrio coralliilyticus]ERB63477.1 endoribonuclease L-PSP [Vibrio coralliilyticus OCN008]KJY69861.1 endoribonuclease L-PSP [Vibrio coralliilyticus]QIJ86487.1 reactive intermediate/imine deaminase [Vibrio coralliilyticus OCN008]QOU32282.1 reactive intermediate/imine deaminase [Vibrio coralliilyticus]